MRTTKELKPSLAPIYAAALYPSLCTIFHNHGYALAAHGSLARDLDLIAIPWVVITSSPGDVIDAICEEFAVRRVEGDPKSHPHGRVVYTLICGFGDCTIDLGFMPRLFAPETMEEKGAQ